MAIAVTTPYLGSVTAIRDMQQRGGDPGDGLSRRMGVPRGGASRLGRRRQKWGEVLHLSESSRVMRRRASIVSWRVRSAGAAEPAATPRSRVRAVYFPWTATSPVPQRSPPRNEDVLPAGLVGRLIALAGSRVTGRLFGPMSIGRFMIVFIARRRRGVASGDSADVTIRPGAAAAVAAAVAEDLVAAVPTARVP